MFEERSQESALAQFYKRKRLSVPPANVEVYLTERPFWGHLNLRGDSLDKTFIEAVQNVLALRLPTMPNTGCIGTDAAALWLGPDEFLILTPPDDELKALNRLHARLRDYHHSVTDVTSGQTIIHLSGRHARDVLAKGCSIDLHYRVFRESSCVQAHLAKANVIIWQPRRLGSFELIVRRSFAEYVSLWIEDAAQEFGFACSPKPSTEEIEDHIFMRSTYAGGT